MKSLDKREHPYSVERQTLVCPHGNWLNVGEAGSMYNSFEDKGDTWNSSNPNGLRQDKRPKTRSQKCQVNHNLSGYGDDRNGKNVHADVMSSNEQSMESGTLTLPSPLMLM